MANHKHNVAIKSPYPCVNEYEKYFNNQWRKNTASCLAELLKYIADAAKEVIKNNQDNVTEE